MQGYFLPPGIAIPFLGPPFCGTVNGNPFLSGESFTPNFRLTSPGLAAPTKGLPASFESSLGSIGDVSPIKFFFGLSAGVSYFFPSSFLFTLLTGGLTGF